MKRGTIILLIFVVIAVGIVAATQFLQRRPPLQITVAVSPLAEGWVRAAADTFNANTPIVNANRRVAVMVTTVEDVDVWNGNTADWADGPLEDGGRPSVWIPASGLSAEYVNSDSRLMFTEAAPSVARTYLVWGGFADRVRNLTDAAQFGFGWQAVQRTALAAEASGDYIDLAFASPAETMPGLAVLLSGAAAYHETPTLDSSQLGDGDFREWLIPVIQSVPNFNTLGADPARAIAQRGQSVADAALLPESQWVQNVASINGEFVLAYPEYPFVFDFPALRWDSATTTDDERAAGEMFVNFLLDNARQTLAADFGLRPADPAASISATTFTNAESYGLRLQPDATNAIAPPDRSTVLRLLTWYEQND